MPFRQNLSTSHLVIGGVSLFLFIEAFFKLRTWSQSRELLHLPLLSTTSFPLALLPSTRLLSTTPFISLAAAPTISYSLYIPLQHYNPDPAGEGPYRPSFPSSDSPYAKPKLPLIVTIHGTTRDAAAARDALVSLANGSRAAILAPLFPAGIDGPNDFDSYKTLRPAAAAPAQGDILFDLALRNILQDLSPRWPGLDLSQIYLVGFSGGASFALRFALAWPHLVSAVSVGAPTGSSVLDLPDEKWPVGLVDVRSIFGNEAFRLDKLSSVAWQLVIGEQDHALEGSLDTIARAVRNETEAANKAQRKENWESVIDRLQPNREDKLKQLARGLRKYGVETKVQVLPGGRHSRTDIQEAVDTFLRAELQRYWQQH